MHTKQDPESLSVDLRSIIDTVPGHIYWCDRAGIILGCNQAQAEFFGHKNQSDLIGKLIYDFYPAESAKILQEATGKVIRENQAITIEEHYTQQGPHRGLRRVRMSVRVGRPWGFRTPVASSP